MVTKDFLLQIFHYDNDQCCFYWKKPTSFRVKKGDRAGYIDELGYRRISINNIRYREHQLVWLIERGSLSILQIDHIDGNKLNNHINNLREVTNKQNSENKSINKNNTSGIKGVYFDKARSKWHACITNNYKNYSLGRFKTIEEAKNAYIYAAKKMHTHNLVNKEQT